MRRAMVPKVHGGEEQELTLKQRRYLKKRAHKQERRPRWLREYLKDRT